MKADLGDWRSTDVGGRKMFVYKKGMRVDLGEALRYLVVIVGYDRQTGAKTGAPGERTSPALGPPFAGTRADRGDDAY